MEDYRDEYFTSPTELTVDRKDSVRDRAQSSNDGQKAVLGIPVTKVRYRSKTVLH